MSGFVITNGVDLSSNAIQAYFDQTAKTVQQTADLVRLSQTTFLDSADLVIPVTAGFAYSLQSCLMYDTAAAADIVIRISYPSGTTGLIVNGGSGTAITTATNAINQQATALSGTSLSLTYGGVAVGTILGVTPSGSLFVTASGNVVIGFAQAVSTASNTLLKKGSFVQMSRTA